MMYDTLNSFFNFSCNSGMMETPANEAQLDGKRNERNEIQKNVGRGAHIEARILTDWTETSTS